MSVPQTMTSLRQAAEWIGADLHGADAHFDQVSTDTRTLAPGALFVALVGERFDGHGHLQAALDAGAVGALVANHQPDVSLPQLVVGDSLIGLQQLAHAWRQQFSLPVIGVTGSNGKTTVKQMLAAVLGTQGSVLATEGNLNNHIGLPLTLLRLRAEHAYAVIEMGANHHGEIATLAAIAEPGIGIITQAGDAHLEGFGDRDGVARAKGELFQHLGEGELAAINADDAYADYWQHIAAPAAVLRFGFDASAQVRAEQVRVEAESSAFELLTPAGRASVLLPLPGKHNVSNALAAAAAATALGLDADSIAAGLASVRNVGGRLRWQTARLGARVLDDSYNANPTSLRAGLELLAGLPGRRWLVLGGMGELGPDTEALHAQAGKDARELGIDQLFTFGAQAAAAAGAFGVGAQRFDDLDELVSVVEAELDASVVVLVKGSRAARMERVVQALCADTTGGSVHAV